AYTFMAIRDGGTACDTAKKIVNIIVNPVVEVDSSLILCFGESFTVNGNTYVESGVYVDTLQSVSGCDSIVTLNLTVLPELAFNNEIVICEGETITVG